MSALDICYHHVGKLPRCWNILWLLPCAYIIRRQVSLFIEHTNLSETNAKWQPTQIATPLGAIFPVLFGMYSVLRIAFSWVSLIESLDWMLSIYYGSLLTATLLIPKFPSRQT